MQRFSFDQPQYCVFVHDQGHWFINGKPLFIKYSQQNKTSQKVLSPNKPNCFVIPTLGELHLLLPYVHPTFILKTTSWTSIDLRFDLPIEDVTIYICTYLKYKIHFFVSIVSSLYNITIIQLHIQESLLVIQIVRKKLSRNLAFL